MLPKSATILLCVFMACSGYPADPSGGFDEAHDGGLKDASFPSYLLQKKSIGGSIRDTRTSTSKNLVHTNLGIFLNDHDFFLFNNNIASSSLPNYIYISCSIQVARLPMS